MGRGQDLTDPEAPEFVVSHLRRSIEGKVIHADLSFSLAAGETLFIQGPSGVGKSVLLRSLASLDPIDSGSITLAGKTPEEYGLPRWRSLVTYVHQQRIALPGTPAHFYERVSQLASQKNRPKGDLKALVSKLGLEEGTLSQPWQELSGGQAQRLSLAIALALKPKVLLLDEPTSSLDAGSTKKVEAVLAESGATLIWVSHLANEPQQVGGKLLKLPEGEVVPL